MARKSGGGLKGLKPMRHGGAKAAPMGAQKGAGPAPAGSGGAAKVGGKGAARSAPPMAGASAGGAVSLSAPKTLKGFGHAVPDMKSLTTDRGSFKLKG